jgi:hypothetical protein
MSPKRAEKSKGEQRVEEKIQESRSTKLKTRHKKKASKKIDTHEKESLATIPEEDDEGQVEPKVKKAGADDGQEGPDLSFNEQSSDQGDLGNGVGSDAKEKAYASSILNSKRKVQSSSSSDDRPTKI